MRSIFFILFTSSFLIILLGCSHNRVLKRGIAQEGAKKSLVDTSYIKMVNMLLVNPRLNHNPFVTQIIYNSSPSGSSDFLDEEILKPFFRSWINWAINPESDPQFAELIEKHHQRYIQFSNFYDFPSPHYNSDFNSDIVSKSFYYFFDNPRAYPISNKSGPIFKDLSNMLANETNIKHFKNRLKENLKRVLINDFGLKLSPNAMIIGSILDQMPELIFELKISKMNCSNLLSSFINY